MTTKVEMRMPRRTGRMLFPGLGLLAAVSLLAAGCGKAEATGNCVQSDTTIVRTNVTKEVCAQVCPTCSWQQGTA